MGMIGMNWEEVTEEKEEGGRDMVWPHDLYVGVILSSEEVIAAVCPHHIFIHGELDLPPELTVLLRAHGQSREPGKRPAEPG